MWWLYSGLARCASLRGRYGPQNKTGHACLAWPVIRFGGLANVHHVGAPVAQDRIRYWFPSGANFNIALVAVRPV
jgi:hypothetical protein